MTGTPRPVCPRTWLDSSTTARRPSSSPWDHRRLRFPGRSTSAAPQPPGGWDGGRFSSWETRARVPGPCQRAWPPSTMLLSPSSSPGPPPWSSPAASARRVWPCERAGRCWWSRTPMISPTPPTVSPGWESPAPSAGIATPRSVPQRNSAACSMTRRIPSGRTTSARRCGREDGVAAACQALEALLTSVTRTGGAPPTRRSRGARSASRCRSPGARARTSRSPSCRCGWSSRPRASSGCRRPAAGPPWGCG